MAARGGSEELFQQALKVLEELYNDGQVRTRIYFVRYQTFQDIFGVNILKTDGVGGDSIAFLFGICYTTDHR